MQGQEYLGVNYKWCKYLFVNSAFEADAKLNHAQTRGVWGGACFPDHFKSRKEPIVVQPGQFLAPIL